MLRSIMGVDALTWGSDYPNEEGHEQPLAELKKTIGCLTEQNQAKILGCNALREYDIG